MPRVLLERGVADMVRISDARMSGTSFGTVVLHVAPESAIGGPLAAVRTGDEIVLDVAGRAHRPAACPPKRSNAAWRISHPLRRITTADMAGCSWSTSRRPTRAATSISCAARLLRRLCASRPPLNSRGSCGR